MYGGGADAMLKDVLTVNEEIRRHFSGIAADFVRAQHGVTCSKSICCKT